MMETNTSGTDMFGSVPNFTGYRYDIENVQQIYAVGYGDYQKWRTNFEDDYKWEPPAEIDPRGWTKTDDQKSMGSCQGNSLANCCEHIHAIETGEVLQLSRAFAYLASQEFDNINGDSGSTLSGGTRAIARGIPTEAVFPYTDNYSDVRRRYSSQKQSILSNADSLYRLDGAVPLTSEEDCYRFLSSRSGIIQIGIMWGLANQWEHTSYRAGGGGHAVNIAGYLRVDSWGGYGYLLHNSWGDDWGRDGWALIHPNAVKQMLAHRWNVFVGRSTAKTPKPKPKPDI